MQTSRSSIVMPALLPLGSLAQPESENSIHLPNNKQAFVGGIIEDRHDVEIRPKPVRNNVTQPGDELVALRHFRIKKGHFDEFLQASIEGVWPYMEKIGARAVGMWKVIHPVIDGSTVSEEPSDYDDVYVMTRYASMAHWRATRDMAVHGGNGPDWVKCHECLTLRNSLTIETSVCFLQGLKWDNDPWFMPGLDENYERVKSSK